MAKSFYKLIENTFKNSISVDEIVTVSMSHKRIKVARVGVELPKRQCNIDVTAIGEFDHRIELRQIVE